jgi:toxin ParE1/3/4
MRPRLIIRPEAEAELAEAFDWYERRVPGVGADFLAAIDVALDSVLSHPFQHPVVCRAARRALIRRFPYQVLFVAEEDPIVVIAVFHGARDPRSWQDRL